MEGRGTQQRDSGTLSTTNLTRQSLKARLQAAEARNEELASAVPEATRPLLRQIEALQASNAEKAKIWEEIERTLTLRINDADLQAQQSIEREREALDKYNETVLHTSSLSHTLCSY